MRSPLRPRLQACASLLPPCRTVADVGTDHGYLPVWLLKNGVCGRAIASDLRAGPLETARRNALRFGTAEQTDFLCCDGLAAFAPGSFDALICAGMGGDCIAGILAAADWLRDPRYTLILQPQSSGNDLRRWLGAQGFSIERELLVRDGRFLYAALRARFGGGRPLRPGEQFVSPALLRENDPLLPDYLARLLRSLRATVAAIRRGVTEDDRRKYAYYSAALEELQALPAAQALPCAAAGSEPSEIV